MARSSPRSEAFAPTTLHEITRRYYACAVQLAKAMGLPLSEQFIRDHRESISSCFIESGRAGVRLPDRVTLPPLAPVLAAAPDGQGNITGLHDDHEHRREQVDQRNKESVFRPLGDEQLIDPDATRITRDAARQLKATAQQAFGYVEGERRLRQALAIEPGKPLTLMRLSKYCTPVQYQALIEAYAATLRAAVDADVG